MSETPNQTAPADWYADPLGRYGFRYWNARHWTAYCLSDDGFHFDSHAAGLYCSESRSKLFCDMHVDLGRKMAHLMLNDQSLTWGDVTVQIADIHAVALWQTPGRRREENTVSMTLWHGTQEFHIDVRYRDFPPDTRTRLELALAGLSNGLDQRVYPWVAAQIVGRVLEGEEVKVGTSLVSQAGIATASKLPWPRTRAFIAWDDVAWSEVIDDDVVIRTAASDENPTKDWMRMSSSERNAPALPLVVADVKELRKLKGPGSAGPR